MKNLSRIIVLASICLLATGAEKNCSEGSEPQKSQADQCLSHKDQPSCKKDDKCQWIMVMVNNKPPAKNLCLPKESVAQAGESSEGSHHEEEEYSEGELDSDYPQGEENHPQGEAESVYKFNSDCPQEGKAYPQNEGDFDDFPVEGESANWESKQPKPADNQ